MGIGATDSHTSRLQCSVDAESTRYRETTPIVDRIKLLSPTLPRYSNGTMPTMSRHVRYEYSVRSTDTLPALCLEQLGLAYS